MFEKSSLFESACNQYNLLPLRNQQGAFWDLKERPSTCYIDVNMVLYEGSFFLLPEVHILEPSIVWKLCYLWHTIHRIYFLLCNKKKPVWLWRRIINQGCKIQPYDLNNNQSITLLTFTIGNVTFLKNEPFMIYQRLKKSGRVPKSQFLEKKSVQRKLNKRIKTDFSGKSTLFESPITHKRFIFEHSYISYRKRQKSCTLIVILVELSYLTSPVFNSPSKSTGFFLLQRRK